MISYQGIDEASLVHGLYHATPPLSFVTPARVIEEASGGASAVTLEFVRCTLARWRLFDGKLGFDYFCGRPLKVDLDTETKTFDERLYDRDAGPGTAQRVVDQLRAVIVK